MRFLGLSHVNWLRYAGLFTYGCVGIPLLRDSLDGARFGAVMAWLGRQPLPGEISEADVIALIGWWLAYIAFGVAFWFATRDLGASRARFVRVPLLMAMNLAAVAISWFSQSGLSGILLLVIAGVLPWMLSSRAATIWAILQNASLLPVFLGLTDEFGEPIYGWFDAVLQSFLYLGFSSFTFATSVVAKDQAEAREEQRRLNSELRATRALLAESSRIAERVRIARELHDLVGHHLTVLTLNLEVASHLVSGQGQEKVRQAQSVAKLLLSDVREVVGQMREDAEIDLGAALKALTDGVPEPKVHLDLNDSLKIENPLFAHVLLRTAQELLTNCMRHAEARNFWLSLNQSKQRIELNAHDDGRGAEAISAGNGLSGMLERFQEVGGGLNWQTAPGKGFSIEAWIPLEAKT
ncbi:sensor histidine kinase [Ahniella affigens]|uniref:Sensor histidine kinase n=1 Tax=Ahniella affigens TaxID=2021234 RepID=A0A2P1PVY3_9GAMM|nr:sensor histidine kinase [Ahniella affigens]AVP98990.1 sensor histidine kinase [Ahniella affigens]